MHVLIKLKNNFGRIQMGGKQNICHYEFKNVFKFNNKIELLETKKVCN